VANTPDMWIRANGAFEGVVEPDFFEAAQRIIYERSRRFTDQDTVRLWQRLSPSGVHVRRARCKRGMPSPVLDGTTPQCYRPAAYRACLRSRPQPAQR